MNDEVFSKSFCILLEDGTEVYPIKMKSRKDKTFSYRVSKHGNESEESEAIADEIELRQHVSGLGYRVRCKSKDGKREGLYSGRQPNRVRAF